MNPSTTPAKNKSLIWIIVFLLLTNLAMLVFFLWFNGPSKKPRGREDFVGSFLQNEMKFDSSQMKAYHSLKEAHMQQARPLFENLRSSKDSFYSMLYTKDIIDSLISTKGTMIGNNQIEVDRSMFQHLRTVRNLCTPDQLTRFDTSFRKVVDKMIGRSRKPKDEKK